LTQGGTGRARFREPLQWVAVAHDGPSGRLEGDHEPGGVERVPRLQDFATRVAAPAAEAQRDRPHQATVSPDHRVGRVDFPLREAQQQTGGLVTTTTHRPYP